MKWLAATFLCLLTGTAIAEPQQQPSEVPTVALPLLMVCSPIDPGPGLQRQYNEIPFVQGNGVINIPGGRQVPGQLKMFLAKDMTSFTIMFNVGEEMFCMVMTGNDIEPAVQGDPT